MLGRRSFSETFHSRHSQSMLCFIFHSLNSSSWYHIYSFHQVFNPICKKLNLAGSNSSVYDEMEVDVQVGWEEDASFLSSLPLARGSFHMCLPSSSSSSIYSVFKKISIKKTILNTQNQWKNFFWADEVEGCSFFGRTQVHAGGHVSKGPTSQKVEKLHCSEELHEACRFRFW
jgi:hypothetical protein